MKADREALRGFFTGALPQGLKREEEAFFAGVAGANCFRLGLLGLFSALLQGISLYALRDMPVMGDVLMRWFTLLAVIGLGIFGLFFLRQSRGKMPANILWVCQSIFAVYYTVVDLCILFLGLQMQSGLMRAVPVILLGAVMSMPGGLSLSCFLGYLVCLPLLLADPALMAYGALAVAAGYLLSRERWRRDIQSFAAEKAVAAAEQEKQALELRLHKMTTWDEQAQMNNRRAMSAWLEAVWPLCVRNRIPVAVLILGPNGLEKAGKEKGPKALAAHVKQFGAALKPFVRRQSDFLGRYGEDTFVILYSGPSREDTDMLAGRIRDALSKQAWEDEGNELISFSLGIVYGLPRDNMVAAQWMTRADEALAKAAAQGPGATVLEEA